MQKFLERFFCIFRATTERADLTMDGAGSSWVAGAVIGSLALVAIIILVVLFRRRIMAMFLQLTNVGNVLSLPPVFKCYF